MCSIALYQIVSGFHAMRATAMMMPFNKNPSDTVMSETITYVHSRTIILKIIYDLYTASTSEYKTMRGIQLAIIKVTIIILNHYCDNIILRRTNTQFSRVQTEL